jgi:alpha-glucosidase
MNQLGLFVCFYSPLQMACDLPENYEKHLDAFRFIEDVPCDWERSLLVDGQIGEFCIFARQQRNADDWYIGGINNEVSRDAEVSLSMLEKGRQYRAVVYRDGETADWKTNPYDYVIEEQTVNSKDTLHIHMASGGGFAVQLKQQD